MKKKIYTKINEYLDNQDDVDMIVEMATINGLELPLDVCVFGGNSYGGGRKEHGEPHFHFSDNIENPQKFKISVLILSLSDWNKSKELIILENESSQTTWSGLKKERRLLLDWLDKPNHNNAKLSNYEAIIFSWNMLNQNNKNVRQIVG